MPLTCFDRAVREIKKNGGELWSGFAVNPRDGRRYSHTWVVRNGEVVDPMKWRDHEPLQHLYVPGSPEFIAAEKAEDGEY